MDVCSFNEQTKISDAIQWILIVICRQFFGRLFGLVLTATRQRFARLPHRPLSHFGAGDQRKDATRTYPKLRLATSCS